MTAHVSPSALLRFCKSLLQVNFAAAHSAAAPLASLFDRLLQPKGTSSPPRRPGMTSPSTGRLRENATSPEATFGVFKRGSGASVQTGCEGLVAHTWPGLLTYCAKLILAEASGDPPLPPFVLDNLDKALRGVRHVLASEEGKRISGTATSSPQAREALEVSGRALAALTEAETGVLQHRFGGLLLAIVRDAKREPLLDLGSPVGSAKPSSPGSWLTPSRTRGKAESPRRKGTPVGMSALGGPKDDRPLFREDSTPFSRVSPGMSLGTERKMLQGAAQAVPVISREASAGKVRDSASAEGLRSVESSERSPIPEDWVEMPDGVEAGADGDAAGTGEDLLFRGEVEESPGSWLTPGFKKTGGVPRISRLRGEATQLRLGEGQEAESAEKGGEEESKEGDDPGDRRIGGERPNGEVRHSFESTDGGKKDSAAEGERKEAKSLAQPRASSAMDNGCKETGEQLETSGEKRGGENEGRKYPRALISGEWRTPEYMKPKGTVARKVKTCERAAAGLRTPDDAAASEEMASVKKVLFAEDGGRPRGRRELEGIGSEVLERRRSLSVGGQGVGGSVPSSGKTSEKKPGFVGRRSLAGALAGEVEPRKVLSPLKQPGAWPVAARKASPFGVQHVGKGEQLVHYRVQDQTTSWSA